MLYIQQFYIQEYYFTDRNGTKNTEIMEGNEDHNIKTRECDLNGADRGYSRRRRRGMSLAPEEVCKLGIHNLGYQNETYRLEMRTINEAYISVDLKRSVLRKIMLRIKANKNFPK